MSLPPEEHFRRVTGVFDLVAEGYDHPALRFFPFCADYMLGRLRPRPGCKVLDVATGTGAVAVAAGQLVGPQGRVQAIDLSESMLDRAFAHVQKMALSNVDLHVMNAQSLEFRGEYFDHVLCSFGLFFLPDMDAALRDWLRVLRPGGTVMFSSFGPDLFHPLTEHFRARMAALDVEGIDGEPAWLKLSDPAQCQALLEAAGAVDVEVETAQLGYHVASAEDWWAVLWNSGFRAFLEKLSPVQLEGFRQAHLEEVQALAGADGLWLNVPVLITRGRRASSGRDE